MATQNKVESNSSFIELHNAGAMKIEKTNVRKSAIIAVQKPIADKFGCIVILEDGSKLPVSEQYDEVMQLIAH